MTDYLRFTHTLADIVNPHPVMFVGEDHSKHVNKLYTIRSLPHLQKKGYNAFAFEAGEDTRLVMEKNKTDLKKLGAAYLDRVNISTAPQVCNALGVYSLHWATQDINLPSYFCDTIPVDLTTVAMESSIAETRKANLVSSHNALFDSELTEISAAYFAPMSEIRLALRYAEMGSRTFANYQASSLLSSDCKEAVLNSGKRLRALADLRKNISHECFQMKARDETEAENIYQLTKRTRGKILAFNGDLHIYQEELPENVDGHVVLPDILEKKYNVLSTRIIMADAGVIKEKRKSLTDAGLDIECIIPAEVIPSSRALFSLSQTEAYLMLQKDPIESKIYDLRGQADLNRVDYAVVTPVCTNSEIFENLKPKIKGMLKLK